MKGKTKNVLAQPAGIVVNALNEENFAGQPRLMTKASRSPALFSSTDRKTEPKPKLVMKPIIPFALLGALFAVGAATAATTTPVGYETLDYSVGFNYLGLRLHESVAASSPTATVAGTTLTFADGIVDALAPGSYIVEVTSGAGLGAVSEVASFDAAADEVVLMDDLAAVYGLATGDSVSIRPLATIESVFGAANEAGLSPGLGGPTGSDQVWLPDGAGGFLKYYFFEDPFGFSPSEWRTVSPDAAVDPGSVSIAYTDSVIVNAAAEGDLTITGEVKLTPTSLGLTSEFNYVSGIYPVGGTLSSQFGAANEAGLTTGLGGPTGADQIWIPSGATFNKFYFFEDPFGFSPSEWKTVSPDASVDPAAIDLSSGFLIQNGGAFNNLLVSPPSFYESL